MMKEKTEEKPSEFSDFDSKRWEFILKQLYKDYEHIAWYFKTRLKTPVISYSDNRTAIAEWDQELRMIRISKKLILNHPWHVVLEVLKHEMAHQYVADILRQVDGHGPHFQAACAKLAVDPWARRAQVDLEGSIDRPLVVDDCEHEPSHPLIKRIHKLFALAGSANEHEAALAMQRARELMVRHEIESIDIRQPSDFGHRVIYLGKKRVERHQAMMAGLLNDFFMVRIIHTNYYDLDKLEQLKAIDLVGTARNLEMAEYVYHFLDERLEIFWDDFRRSMRAKGQLSSALRGQKKSFIIGVLKGFESKLKAQQFAEQESQSERKTRSTSDLEASMTSEQRGRQLNGIETLQLVEQGLDRALGDRFPRIQKKSYSSGRGMDQGAFDAGRKCGKSLNIHRPVHGRSSQRGILGSGS
jgi:predicted SprT family Zn-dependent metalloprotease